MDRATVTLTNKWLPATLDGGISSASAEAVISHAWPSPGRQAAKR
jgi:hypothetical protein